MFSKSARTGTRVFLKNQAPADLAGYSLDRVH